MTPVLVLTACIAMALIVFRAATQAISIDEASTYLLFVGAEEPLHWIGSGNNHVLNTALMRLTTRLFGVSDFFARLPALLGGALYISACYRFCRRLEGGAVLRWSALVCLIYSPFIMDYLVAARGYGLALGFLMTALVADCATVSGCVLASTALGLCFASNFSFAFVCAAVGASLLVRAWRERRVPSSRLIAAFVLPPILTTWVIAVPTIVNFPRAELYYGSHSLLETGGSLLVSQLAHHTAWLYLVPALITLVWWARIWNRIPAAALLLAAAILGTLALHFVAFHAFGLLYPMDRTGVFLVPLTFCAIAAAAVVPGGWLRTAQVGALVFAAILSVALMRLDRFEEWDFNADTGRIYSTLQCLRSRHGVSRFAAGWPFFGAMNFYRYVGGDPLAEVADEAKADAATEVFVLDSDWNPTVVNARSLTVVWRSRESHAILAASAGAAARLEGSACF